MNFSEIFEGWKNDLFPSKDVKEEISRISSQRLLICQECPLNSNKAKQNGYITIRTDYHCTECGCPLKKKTKCLSCECPIKKWAAETTEQEEQEIKNIIK